MTLAAVPMASQSRASFAQRAIAFVLDLLPLLVITPITVVPEVGERVYLLLATIWWMMRDVQGASLGKRILGMRVEDYNGSPVSPRQAALRNITFAGPILLALIPSIGLLLAPAVGALLCFGEVASFVFTGERVGDRLARTAVRRG